MITRLARAFLWIGSVCSAGLCIYAGRNNPSILLRLLFVLWVLFPYASTLIASRFSTDWKQHTGSALHVAALLFTVATVAVYARVAFGHTDTRMGFVFLVIPPASGLLIAIVTLIASLF